MTDELWGRRFACMCDVFHQGREFGALGGREEVDVLRVIFIDNSVSDDQGLVF